MIFQVYHLQDFTNQKRLCCFGSSPRIALKLWESWGSGGWAMNLEPGGLDSDWIPLRIVRGIPGIPTNPNHQEYHLLLVDSNLKLTAEVILSSS